MTLVYFSSFFSSLGDQIWQGHINLNCEDQNKCVYGGRTHQKLPLWFKIPNEQVEGAYNPNLKPTWFKEELENVTAEPILATLQMQSTDVFAITAQSWSILKFSDCHLDVIECYWLISCKTISEKCQFVCFRQNLTTDVLWCIETVSSCFWKKIIITLSR